MLDTLQLSVAVNLLPAAMLKLALVGPFAKRPPTDTLLLACPRIAAVTTVSAP